MVSSTKSRYTKSTRRKPRLILEPVEIKNDTVNVWNLKTIFKLTELIVLTILFCGCDPGHSGNTILNNQTSYTLELKYKTGRVDTIITIQPNNTIEIYHFGGLGEGRDYTCCPCEFKEISLTVKDSVKTITKLVTNTDNWILVNDNTKRYSSKEINCSFLLEQKDIQ